MSNSSNGEGITRFWRTRTRTASGVTPARPPAAERQSTRGREVSWLFPFRNGLCAESILSFPGPGDGRISEFLHRVLNIMAAPDPQHLAKIGEGGLGAKELPFPALVSFPGPGDPVAIVSGDPHAPMIAERLVPHDSPTETVPR